MHTPMTFHGAFNPNAHYPLAAVVTFSGTAYISTVEPNAGNVPSTSGNAWSPFAVASPNAPQS